MSLNNLVKRLQDIMRNDAGINGDAQRIEQMVWILFLKVYDAKEEIWEFYDENYTSIIPEELRWRNWAVDHKDGKALTGDALLDFVNGKLFPTLKAIAIDENTPMSQIIVRTAFEKPSYSFSISVSRRRRFSSAACASSPGRPQPSSVKVSSHAVWVRRSAILTLPPSRLARSALESRCRHSSSASLRSASAQQEVHPP